jgi:hypothetical protein
MLWTYSFCVWPDETRERWSREAFALFRMVGTRVAMDFTREAFERFRSALFHDGLTLREVERVPFHEPEGIP